MTPFIITLAVIAAAIIMWVILLYNRLIRLKNRVDESWSDIDVQLKRRYDLIPNLIETVKGYAAHERQLFTDVTMARTAAMSSGSSSVADKARAENALSSTLKSLFAVAEQYPDLKASGNFAKLQDELSDTENKIQAARRFYNGNVRDYNTSLEIFPSNLIASQLNFHTREFFEISEQKERDNIAVSF